MSWRALIAVFMLLVAFACAAWTQNEPEGFRHVLPRGRLAAIDEPNYVAASEARIAPSSWVLGVVIDGQARAYSLNLLE